MNVNIDLNPIADNCNECYLLWKWEGKIMKKTMMGMGVNWETYSLHLLLQLHNLLPNLSGVIFIFIIPDIPIIIFHHTWLHTFKVHINTTNMVFTTVGPQGYIAYVLRNLNTKPVHCYKILGAIWILLESLRRHQLLK